MGADVYKGSWDAEGNDYFRDSYNDSSVLARMGLSWWRDVVPLHDDDGVMSVANIRQFRAMVLARVCREITEKEREAWDASRREIVENAPHLLPIVGAPLDDAYFVNKRNLLIAFLDDAVARNLPLHCSL